MNNVVNIEAVRFIIKTVDKRIKNVLIFERQDDCGITHLNFELFVPWWCSLFFSKTVKNKISKVVEEIKLIGTVVEINVRPTYLCHKIQYIVFQQQNKK